MHRTLWAGLALLASSSGLWAQAGQPNASYLEKLAVEPALPTVQYDLDLTHPGSHLAGVTLTAPATGSETTVELPVWYPGRYSIYHFAANVQQVSASCADAGASQRRQLGGALSASGRTLPEIETRTPSDHGDRPGQNVASHLAVVHTTPHSWSIRNGGCRLIRWRYRVYGNQPLNGSFFQLDNAHANLNGGPVYMYVQGEKPNPVRLTVRAPAGWNVLNELGALNQTQIWFPNYDIFIDAPMEAAPDFTLDTFHSDGKSYRVLIHDFLTPNDNAANRQQLLHDLQRIVHVENQVIGPDELSTYTFFFHFDQNSSDGMEHLFGTQIMTPAGLGTQAGLQGTEEDAAHEFFHQWNVKRIRPLALGPWNYEAENPTPSLWVAEGFTQYYGDLSLERAGLVPQDAYLHLLGGSMGRSWHEASARLMSPEESSITAWFHDATPLLQDTNRMVTTSSYYFRGEQLAAVLDLDLRRRTQGRKSLDDVMRWLWLHTYHAPRTTYYLPGRGYTDADVEHAIEAVAGGGASYAAFFQQYVAGTRPLPYNDYLAAAGLQLVCRPAPGVASFTGVGVNGNTVQGVVPGSPGEAAGFGRGQLIETVNGQPLKNGSLNALPPNQTVSVVVREHGATVTLRLTPAAPQNAACTMQDLPQVTPAERALRQAWLGQPGVTETNEYQPPL